MADTMMESRRGRGRNPTFFRVASASRLDVSTRAAVRAF